MIGKCSINFQPELGLSRSLEKGMFHVPVIWLYLHDLVHDFEPQCLAVGKLQVSSLAISKFQ
jgi:hypothetical protein